MREEKRPPWGLHTPSCRRLLPSMRPRPGSPQGQDRIALGPLSWGFPPCLRAHLAGSRREYSCQEYSALDSIMTYIISCAYFDADLP